MLTGGIPPAIGECTALTKLTLYSNYLDGNLPESLCDLTSLVVLNVSDNNLDGSVPEDLLSSCQKILDLSLGGNCKRLEDAVDTLVLHRSVSAPTDMTMTNSMTNSMSYSRTGNSTRTGIGGGIGGGALVISRASTQWQDDKGPYTFKEKPSRALKEWKRFSKFRKAAQEREQERERQQPGEQQQGQ